MSVLAKACASAPGKINLILNVARPDERGYHPLFSVFDTVENRETVCLTLSYTDQARPVEITTKVKIDPATDAKVEAALAKLNPAQNLAVKAVLAVAKAGASARCRALRDGQLAARVEVVKTIPMSGGMAGGSADAAAALVAANAALAAELSEDELHRLARQLGADVPACLAGEVSVATWYGDHIDATISVPTHYWVLALAHEGLSTAAVFAAFDQAQRGREILPTGLDQNQTKALQAGHLAQVLENDLQATAAQRPDLAATLTQLEQRGESAILSGSGPTIAVLATDAEHAHRLAHELRTWPTVAATVVTTAPSAPARLEWAENYQQ